MFLYTRCIPMPEFSRILKSEDIAALPVRREICATEDECFALAQRFHLEALLSLDAILEISPWIRLGARVSGDLQAQVVQRCVISLESMRQAVSHAFVSCYSHPSTFGEFYLEQRSVDWEAPEIMDKDGIDLGELIAQQLCLALDPYPRLPDSHLPDFASGNEAEGGPFSALATLIPCGARKQG